MSTERCCPTGTMTTPSVIPYLISTCKICITSGASVQINQTGPFYPVIPLGRSAVLLALKVRLVGSGRPLSRNIIVSIPAA